MLKQFFKEKRTYNIGNCIECPFCKMDKYDEHQADFLCLISSDVNLKGLKHYEQYEKTRFVEKCPLNEQDILIRRIPKRK